MKKAFALIFIMVALGGCATTANYEKVLASWVGYSELDIIRKWGAPQQSYETGGRKFIVYTNSRNVYIPGTASSYRTTTIGNTAYTNSVSGTSGQNISLSCQTTFEISNDKIVSWSYKGNDCKTRI